MGLFHRWIPAVELDEGTRADLLAIPGVKVPGAIAAPVNAAWLVEGMLSARGIAARSLPPPVPRSRSTAALALPWLLPWVPAYLTPYQREGIAWVLNLPGQSGHMHWSAGSGKTLAAITWSLAAGCAVTVVVTKTAVRESWAAQVDQYAQGVEVIQLEGTKAGGFLNVHGSDRTHPLIVVIGYDVLPDWIAMLETLRPRSVVFDEVHKVKSHKRWDAKVIVPADTDTDDDPDLDEPPPAPKVTFSLKDNIAAAAFRLSRVAKRRLATTATPIKDRVRDLWAQLDLIHPWEWGNFSAFAKRYCAAVEGQFGGLDTRGASNLVELKQRLAYVSHRVPFSIANRDLPPKRRNTTWIRVVDQNRVEGSFAAEIKRAAKAGRNAMIEARLMEAASRKRRFIMARTQEWLEGGQKITILTGRREDVERTARDARELSGLPESFRVWAGHGGHSTSDRHAMRLAYMAHPGPCLLVGTAEAWGEGLDLQDTDTAIHAMLPYTPGQVIQNEGRFSRRGQKRAVLNWYPVAEGTIDEHVAAILLKKLPAVEKATDSDEIAGLGRELIGASEEELIDAIAGKILGGSSEAS